MEFFYTFQHNGISYDVVWQDDIPTLSPISNYDEFNSIVEKNVDELSDMWRSLNCHKGTRKGPHHALQ